MRELDYRVEAHNLATLRRNLERFERIVVPAPVEKLTTRRVLTMDWVEGRKVTDVDPETEELDGQGLAEELFQAYLQQILLDGFFHADPHPGNVFLTDDGKLALIDLGMVARLSPRMQEHLLRLVVAISEGDGDEAADVALDIGVKLEGFDRATCVERIVELVCWSQGADVEDLQFGRTVLEVGRLCGDCGVRVPHDLLLLGKALLNLDGIGRRLAPSFRPNAAVRRNSAELWTKRAWRSITPSRVIGTAADTRDFVRALPARTARIMDAIANNEIEIKVDAIDEDRVISGLQAIANRITVGLVIAALVVGGSLLMRVETPFRLFGHPGLGMVLLLLAGIVGVCEGIQALRHRGRRRHR
jgi:predicted unusual protein kinase regulating ubiquinone biosynthesis (AarF/ABC1/UbiB family)